MADYYRLDFSFQPKNIDAADLLAAFLADAGFESFEETEGGMAAYVQTKDYNEEAVREAVKAIPFDVAITWEQQLIHQQDWNSEWERKYFKPLVLADGRCVVHSSFHKDYPHAEVEIVVDPKMAFGTGHHATTSLMVESLFQTQLEGKTVMDMGTGTGILAIVVKKLGAREATGIEIDPGAYENALENIALNNVEVILLQGDASLLPAEETYDVFLANINRNIILADVDRYVKSIRKGGTLLLSGFYTADIPLLQVSLEALGMKVVESKEAEGNWAVVRAVKIS